MHDLQFRELKIGDYFISSPSQVTFEDAVLKQRYLAYHVFQKITPSLFHNSKRLIDGVASHIPDLMPVVKLLF